MKKVFFATPIRGFFKHLFNEKCINANFLWNEKSLYEVNSTIQTLKKRIGHSWILDCLGYIQAPSANNKDCDIYASFNRFLNVDKPYFIYVENPTALYHYRLNRGKTYLGIRRLKKMVLDTHLKALVCMSKACQKTFEQVCIPLPNNVNLSQIYPLVPDNPFVNKTFIENKVSKSNILKLLFIAQGIRFLSKGALEVIEAFKRLRDLGLEVRLTIITSLSDADKNVLNMAKDVEGISLYDFKFSFEELQKIYADHSVLLIPTSDDSFNLTVLEAMKAGLPIIGSSLYAIPEMVMEGCNGFLTEPAYYFFDKDCIPNPKVWNNRKKTIYSGKRDERVCNFLVEKLVLLYNDRELLKQMSLNSLDRSSTAPFSKEYIIGQWNLLLNEINADYSFME